MTVLERVRKYMENNLYTALLSDECGCPIEDLACCDGYFGNCEFGYANDCRTCADKETCEIRNSDIEIMCRKERCWKEADDDGRD